MYIIINYKKRLNVLTFWWLNVDINMWWVMILKLTESTWHGPLYIIIKHYPACPQIPVTIQHFTRTLVVTSHKVNARSVCAVAYLCAARFRWLYMPTRSIECKGRRCKVTVLVKCCIYAVRPSNEISCFSSGLLHSLLLTSLLQPKPGKMYKMGLCITRTYDHKLASKQARKIIKKFEDKKKKKMWEQGMRNIFLLPVLTFSSSLSRVRNLWKSQDIFHSSVS